MSVTTRYELVLLFWIVCGIWIYTDGKSRKLKDPLSWALIGVFFGIFGVIGYWYFVLRPNKRG